jgi:uncharacterized protein YutE (UPF0331/DUF86 family)
MENQTFPNDYYKRVAGLIYHYAKYTFFQIYPLSQNEFKEDSMHRRAAYDYIVQIVEKSSDMAKKTMGYFFKIGPQDSYRERFLKAKYLQIIPSRMADTLISLSDLRTKIVHYNDLVNEKLPVIYGQLGIIVTVAFAMHELTKTYHSYLVDRDAEIANILIDKKYLIRLVDIYISNNAGANLQVLRNYEKQRLRLINDASIPSFTINTKAINRIVQII